MFATTCGMDFFTCSSASYALGIYFCKQLVGYQTIRPTTSDALAYFGQTVTSLLSSKAEKMKSKKKTVAACMSFHTRIFTMQFLSLK